MPKSISLGTGACPRPGEEDVVRLQVAVDDPALVRGGERREDLEHDVAAGRPRRAGPLAPAAGPASRRGGARGRRGTGSRRRGGPCRRWRRCWGGRGCRRPGPRGGGGAAWQVLRVPGVQHLDRHQLPQGEVLGLVDHAHAALADDGGDPVAVADDPAGEPGGRRRRRNTRGEGSAPRSAPTSACGGEDAGEGFTAGGPTTWAGHRRDAHGRGPRRNRHTHDRRRAARPSRSGHLGDRRQGGYRRARAGGAAQTRPASPRRRRPVARAHDRLRIVPRATVPAPTFGHGKA